MDINCSKMWVQGHEEVLGVSWTSSNPTSHTALMTLYLVGRERKRSGTRHSVREELMALCSAPLLSQGVTIRSWGRKEKKLEKPPQSITFRFGTSSEAPQLSEKPSQCHHKHSSL